MKKQIILVVLLVIALALGVYALVRNQASELGEYEANNPPSNSETANNVAVANSNTSAQPKDSLQVSAQMAGGTVDIDQVTLSDSGFIAIHELTNGKPGKIIGSSKLLTAGTKQDVVINVKTQAGKTYVAMLHLDDGDGKFDPTKDLPVMNAGNMVMTQFSVTK